VNADEWNARYAEIDLVWGAEPNRFVAAELADRPSGHALDVACGEGRNAIWLASRGWSVVGIDFSATAIDRARRLAEQAGVSERTDFAVVDVATDPLPAGSYDAVVISYLHLSAEVRSLVIGSAAELVARDGVLLVVGHDSTNLTAGVGGPQDPDVLFDPEDIVADIGGQLVIDKAERVHRPVTTPDGDRVAIDALVLASRH